MAYRLFQRDGCPFFGFEWPERSETLTQIGRPECALTFEKHENCRMEEEGRNAYYHLCPVSRPYAAMLEVARGHIRFRSPDAGVSMLFADWMRTHPKRDP